MSAISKEEYRKDPCGASSIPYWKAVNIAVPENMRILHHTDFRESLLEYYTDEPYFRLCHTLRELDAPVLPAGFCVCNATMREFVEHINRCYPDIGVTEAELCRYTTRNVYDDSLWLAVRDEASGEVVATGIGELDRELSEGILEWIQVSQNHRGKGLGSYIVSELLWRMKGKAGFATVSGQCNNATNPEKLYRKCGFTGNDVWHILRKR